ncbi:MAG: bifunctional (p)ppGpp synthetase/guanosine-3',5'-bis(diphosphate) 3'-pyrophosphohydrolase [Proteobacteria bacterium]|nr:bifunctional (p)ppGpp synthetase/guanosine-3',5'-bis(diphosphate) 3'-pyrophosphohydrolase [Pseudomonadota bacterium]MBU1710372.1 bifunctional (p)ppGpp synthetase/guanosine-3',5'-bis(diphosphate) 3'-pyrophosphohydrolase [Pseudomonadota bacterium]
MSDLTINTVIEKVQGYLPEENLSKFAEAYDFAAKIHEGRFRDSGEPYITHPLAVADILASMRLDIHTVLAGILHGVLKEEKNPATEKELAAKFGKDVASLVSGATRITDVKFNSKLAYQAENVRKMLLAMSSDIRVLLVKLADRLHDMQTLVFTEDRQKFIPQETMDLYAPLASRLGIDWMKRELEDLAFAYLYPEEYADLSGRMETSTKGRQIYVEEVKEILYAKLREYGLSNCRILGRPKHLFSIYKKIIAQKIPLEKIYDKIAFRIILNTVKECYEALGVVHSQWRPVSGRFKDFISTPKSNMYQSLHTSVVGPHGEFMEIQIRTEEMDEIAKEGIAAHWAYKEGKAISSKDAKLFQWLKQLIHNLQELQDPKEFLDAVKGELHEIEVYALTPNGEVKEFPQGSTPLDFAYSIHTEVGNHCAGAKVNSRMVPLKYQLQNGDLVEILTSPGQKPNRGWLSLVKTSRAKNHIRHWLKQENHQKHLEIGREICDRELRKNDISFKKIIKTGHFREILKSLACNSLDDLLSKVGSGKISTQTIISQLQPKEINKEEKLEETLRKKSVYKPEPKDAIKIDGAEGVLTNISQCCMPVPGDEIMGFITAGRGISVHKTNCPNILASDPDRQINVNWATSPNAAHRAKIMVIAQDKKGLLADLSQAISADNANVLNLEARTSSSNLATFNFVLEVSDLGHLTKLLQHIQQLDGVIKAKRQQ